MRRFRNYLVGVSIVVISLLVPVVAAGAAEAMSSANPTAAKATAKLDETHKKVCEARATVIKNVMQRVTNQGAKHIDTFSKIASRIEQFYVTKKLSVSNYDALVAAVSAKQTAATNAVNTAKATTFDCSVADPTGVIGQFKTQIQTMRQAIKDYRTAINSLLIAVKQAAQTTKGGTE